MDEARRADLAAFFQSNAARLTQLYEAGGGFCWPGLVAPQAWFLYRKMYRWAALVSAWPLLIGYLPEFVWLNWATSLVGVFGLKLYFAHAERILGEIRAGDAQEAAGLIARAGGVSRVGAAFGLLFAFAAFVLSLKSAPPLIR